MVDDGTNAAISAILLLQLSNQVQRLALGDHRQQPRILLTVEGRLGRRCWIATNLRLLDWGVKPEAYVEGMDRHKRVGWVHDKGLLIEDTLNSDFGIAIGVALYVGLVPTKTETGEGALI